MPLDPAYTRRILLGHGVGAALAVPFALRAAARPSAMRATPGRHPAAARTMPLVVLDPGHGGRDPGAVGVSGTYEKQIAFAAAGELARQLRSTGRYRVVLTRENDVFIPLEDRVAIAQAHGAALFISLHADALADRRVSGVSVYTLAATASDTQTARLAEHENVAGGLAAGRPAGISPHIAGILASLEHHETQLGSARLQQHVLACLGTRAKLLDAPARHAHFAVLKAADIPSVLVEMGFMSNAHDEAALRQPAHRAIVATELCRAVDRFFASEGQLTASIG